MVRSFVAFAVMLAVASAHSGVKGGAPQLKGRWFEARKVAEFAPEEIDEGLLSPAFRPVEHQPIEASWGANPSIDEGFLSVDHNARTEEETGWAAGHPESTSGLSIPVWPGSEANSGILSPAFLMPPPAPRAEPAAEVAANYRPAEPYSFGYETDLGDASTTRHEVSTGKRVEGSYSIKLDSGAERTVYYIADQDGYRVRMVTNEKGTQSMKPAGVVVESSQLPAAEITRQFEPQRLAELASRKLSSGPRPRNNGLVHDERFEERSASQTHSDFRSATFHAPAPGARRAGRAEEQFEDRTEAEWSKKPLVWKPAPEGWKSKLSAWKAPSSKQSQPKSVRSKISTWEAPTASKGIQRRLKAAVKTAVPIRQTPFAPQARLQWAEEERPVPQTELRWVEPVAYKVEFQRPDIVPQVREKVQSWAPAKGGLKAPEVPQIPRSIAPKRSWAPAKGALKAPKPLEHHFQQKLVQEKVWAKPKAAIKAPEPVVEVQREFKQQQQQLVWTPAKGAPKAREAAQFKVEFQAPQIQEQEWKAQVKAPEPQIYIPKAIPQKQVWLPTKGGLKAPEPVVNVQKAFKVEFQAPQIQAQEWQAQVKAPEPQIYIQKAIPQKQVWLQAKGGLKAPEPVVQKSVQKAFKVEFQAPQIQEQEWQAQVKESPQAPEPIVQYQKKIVRVKSWEPAKGASKAPKPLVHHFQQKLVQEKVWEEPKGAIKAPEPVVKAQRPISVRVVKIHRPARVAKVATKSAPKGAIEVPDIRQQRLILEPRQVQETIAPKPIRTTWKTEFEHPKPKLVQEQVQVQELVQEQPQLIQEELEPEQLVQVQEKDF